MPSHTQLPNYTPQQQELFSKQFGNLDQNSFLGKLAGGDQSTFEQMEAPAMQQFQGLQSGLASQFSGGMGAGGRVMSARRGSGFFNTQNQASMDFAGQLQANRQNMRMQAIQGLHGMSMDLLNQKPFSYVEKQQKQKTNWFGPIMGMVGSALSGPLGGMLGTALGGSMGGGGGGGGGTASWMGGFGGGGGGH